MRGHLSLFFKISRHNLLNHLPWSRDAPAPSTYSVTLFTIYFGVARSAVLFFEARCYFGRLFAAIRTRFFLTHWMVVLTFFLWDDDFWACDVIFEWFFCRWIETNRCYCLLMQFWSGGVAGGRFLKPGGATRPLAAPWDIVTFLTCVWGGVLTTEKKILT